MFRTAQKFLPANRQGIAVDALSILLNLFLFPVLSGRLGKLFDESFGNNEPAFRTLAALMLFILACRLVGLYLKRFPLQARLEAREKTSFPLYFLIFNVPVFILTAAFVTVLLTHLFGEAGIVETGDNGAPKDSQALSLALVFLMIVLMSLEAYFLFRLTRPLDEKEKQMRARRDWRFGWKTELLADFGLFAYMMIWQVFYSYTASIFLTPPAGAAAEETLGVKLFSLFFLGFAFLLFYLAPRSVFLIDDRQYPGTWLFILFVFLSSIASNW